VYPAPGYLLQSSYLRFGAYYEGKILPFDSVKQNLLIPNDSINATNTTYQRFQHFRETPIKGIASYRPSLKWLEHKTFKLKLGYYSTGYKYERCLINCQSLKKNGAY
jgi:hypothetical protein